uniref:Uncharacterized protein n=1 Tax=Triticum urartu TaxID=4572 RepID=A0A8R7QTT1_TRIUA
MPGSLFLILPMCIYASSTLTLLTPATEHPSAWCSSRFPSIFIFYHPCTICFFHPMITLYPPNLILYRYCSNWEMVDCFGQILETGSRIFFSEILQVIVLMASGQVINSLGLPYFILSIHVLPSTFLQHRRLLIYLLSTPWFFYLLLYSTD